MPQIDPTGRRVTMGRIHRSARRLVFWDAPTARWWVPLIDQIDSLVELWSITPAGVVSEFTASLASKPEVRPPGDDGPVFSPGWHQIAAAPHFNLTSGRRIYVGYQQETSVPGPITIQPGRLRVAVFNLNGVGAGILSDLSDLGPFVFQNTLGQENTNIGDTLRSIRPFDMAGISIGINTPAVQFIITESEPAEPLTSVVTRMRARWVRWDPVSQWTAVVWPPMSKTSQNTSTFAGPPLALAGNNQQMHGIERSGAGWSLLRQVCLQPSQASGAALSQLGLGAASNQEYLLVGPPVIKPGEPSTVLPYWLGVEGGWIKAWTVPQASGSNPGSGADVSVSFGAARVPPVAVLVGEQMRIYWVRETETGAEFVRSMFVSGSWTEPVVVGALENPFVTWFSAESDSAGSVLLVYDCVGAGSVGDVPRYHVHYLIDGAPAAANPYLSGPGMPSLAAPGGTQVSWSA